MPDTGGASLREGGDGGRRSYLGFGNRERRRVGRAAQHVGGRGYRVGRTVFVEPAALFPGHGDDRGSLVMKILQGAGFEEFARELKTHYKTVKHHRPKATRSESKEVFLIGLHKL